MTDTIREKTYTNSRYDPQKSSTNNEYELKKEMQIKNNNKHNYHSGAHNTNCMDRNVIESEISAIGSTKPHCITFSSRQT